MKNRPLKHKATNVFHFKSFRDRIKEIDVRRGALYRVETGYELPDDEEGTYFHQAIKKWSVLNLTDEYTAFQRGFKQSVTLPLLLCNKDAIVEHLTACLQKSTDAALQPLLELLLGLAKDLRKDFQAYFSNVFEVLVQFLYSTSADRVEWTLLCLAHLFKILRTFLRSDFGFTFNRLLPLLDEKNSPPHAVDFATECLGYLARDLKDKRPLVDLLLKWQMKNDAYTVACGRLLFEVLHGVQEQFHTTAKQTMRQLYEIMEQLDETEADHLQEILTQTFTDVVESVQAEDIPIFWEAMRVTIDAAIAKLDEQGKAENGKPSESNESSALTPEARVMNHLTRLLQLSGIVLEHNDGRLLGDALSTTVSQLIKLLTSLSSPSEEFLETTVNQIILLLRSKHIRLTQLEASRLTMNVLMLDHRPLYERFIAATVNCTMFEALIWPNFVKTIEAELDDERLRFLARLLLQKVPPCGNGLRLDNWKQFPVPVVANGNVERYMDKLLAVKHVELEYVLEHFELYLSVLIVLPHLANYRGTGKAVIALKDSIEYAVQFLQQQSSSSNGRMTEKIVQLIAVTVETILHLHEIRGKDCFEMLEWLLPIVTMQDCLLLNSVHLLVVVIEEQWKSLLTFARFERIRPFVHPLLFSYDITVRQLASSVLAKFASLSELSGAIGPLYSTLAQIEAIEPLIHTYREQVLLFQHLAHDSQLYQQAANSARTEWTETVLRYMLSVFGVNFKLLWEPTATIVQGYGENMIKGDEQLFWTVFESMMTLAEQKRPHPGSHPAALSAEEEEEEPEDEESMATEDVDDDPLLPKVMACFAKKTNIDYPNVRVQMLRALQRCTHFCRSKGERIVERFFAFLESDDSKSKGDIGSDSTPAVEAASPSTVDSEIRRKSSKGAGTGTQRLLLCYLNICIELGRKSARKQANRLYATYETLASSRNEEIQKAALNGIFSYGDPQLVPYKDFIFRLTGEKTLKNALVSVFVPSEDEPDGEEADAASSSARTKIAEEHRPKVVQLMLKVLDGRIIQNLGSGGPFKAAILTFIGRLRVEELDMLLRRWFEPYLQQFKGDPLETVRSLPVDDDDDDDGEPDTRHIIPTPPPYRLNMLLKLLSCLLTEVVPLQSVPFARRVLHLKILFDALLMRMDHSIYRKYKTQTLLNLVDVFNQYEESYQWTDEELRAIMHVHVWPQLENLPSDSIHTPTPLLKLLFAWSGSERLYVLLERHRYDDGHERDAMQTEDRSMTPLDAMIALLKSSQTSGGVCTEIFTALASMLECDAGRGEQAGATADDDDDERMAVPSGTVDPLTQRGRLLIPYVKELLQYIRQSVKSKKSISSNLLLVLTRIAESGMIDGDQKDAGTIENDRNSLLSLLFPILRKKVATVNDIVSDHLEASEDIRRLHTIIMRLLKESNAPHQYLKQMAQLLETVKDYGSRKTLLQMFANLAPLSPELQLIATLVQQLNAMDKRWVDQPDHTIRLAAYRSIDPLLAPDAPEHQRMTGNVAIVFLSQAFHVLQFEKELSSRLYATEYACKVIVFLATATEERAGEVQYCVDRIVLRGITSGLRVKRTTSDRRSESIQLLGELCRKVGEVKDKVRPEFRVFTELWLFTGPGEGSRELDLFENVTHLQSHNHRKALKRLAIKLAGLADGSQAGGSASPLSPRTVVQFLLPIVSHYIGHEAYKKQTNLVEEAGSCIINLCRLLPWRSYHTVLQQFLKKLRHAFEYQKQLLRIVIGIMDGFHFDLSIAAVPAPNDEGGDEEKRDTLKPGRNALMDKKLQLTNDTPSEEATDEKDDETGTVIEKAEGEEKAEDQGEQDIEDEDEDEDEIAAALEEEEKVRKRSLDARRVAQGIVDDIARTIIPSLLSSFHFANEAPVTVSGKAAIRSQADKKARFAKQKDEMLKLPIAIAIVKLFMKLPRRQIELNLPKLIIKVITFLKSRLKLVRAQARNTLAHITLELGPSYLSFVLQNLLAMLTKGFQRHVLTFTVHTVIERAQKHLSSGRVLEDIMQTVLQICMEDVFGQLIALVNGTTIEGGSLRKVSMPESKLTRKPYQTLFLLARHASEPMLVDLLAPFRAVLLKYRTHQTVAKVQDAFRRLAEGIVANESIAPEALLAFVYGMASGKIYAQCAARNGEEPEAVAGNDTTPAGRKLLGKVAKPGSIYLIPAEPKRYGSAAAAANLDYTLAKTDGNDHVFLECGLEILLGFVKQQHVGARHDRAGGELFRDRIDPIVPLLVQSLDSKHARITCHAVNCVGMLFVTGWPLESFKRRETMDAIVKAIFAILHRYNTVALDVNNPNFAMVKASFQTLVSILKHMRKVYTLTPEQLRLLVMYIDQDVAVGGGRRTMAFVLLRALVARRCSFAELHDLMKKVFETSVRSDSESERAECRQIAVEYIMSYTSAKKVQNHLLFFADQLKYEVLFGRESAALLLKTLFQKLPKETIDRHHSAMFFALGVRLVNEDSTEIRTLVADCLETLLKRLEAKQKREELVPIIADMLADRQLKHRELATQLLLRIMRSEPTGAFIGSWLDKVQASLLLNLVPQIVNDAMGNGGAATGMYVKPIAPVTTLLNADTRGDHLIIQTLHVFEELLRLHPTMLTDAQHHETIDALAYTAQTLLGSGHRWIRLGALKILYQVMNELDFDAIHERIKATGDHDDDNADEDEKEDHEDGSTPSRAGRQFFYRAPLRDSKSLTLDLCAQLTPGGGMVDDGDDEAAALVTQILFLLANVLRAVPLKEESSSSSSSSSSKKINLYWLLRRVRYVIQSEVLKTPHLYTLRKHALHWMSSVVAILEQDMLEQLAPALLIPAVRELTAQEASTHHKAKSVDSNPAKASLHKVATKLCKGISARLGTATYDKIRGTLEESLRRKRVGRKVQLAQEKINQPMIAARRKESKKLRGKEAKKRKVQSRSETEEAKGDADGSVVLGLKRRAKPSKGGFGGAPKKRTKMEALFRD